MSWITTMNFCKLNEAPTPVTAAVPDVLSLLEQINTSSYTWPATINRANVLSSLPVSKDQESATFL